MRFDPCPFSATAIYLKKAAQWDALLAEIREKHRNRPQFMEILDRFEGRTILASQKGRRRKQS